ncbi:MAG TPA: helix-turn-helix transcriptional regulator [Candidatus Ornithomonoglobus intestinigallinarum]|uniref:Helix-turn-helix transcriptional regulator n=1 Tax=Candidatus Ornithomonoglobus intestinigallinarum TaxID=2840894 RepID=A0A9D1H436_9FIRM|nr:helix-turn-helix transcriptional regulator [Candidatus Ornithomonoglobus intestinigallinarum]
MFKADNTVHSSKNISESFERMVIEESERVKPIIREQFLKEYIFGTGDTDEIFELYCRTFDTDKMTPVRMIILKPSDGCSDEDLYFVKNAAERCLGEDAVLLSVNIRNSILLLTSRTDRAQVKKLTEKVRAIAERCYGLNISAIYSKTAPIVDAPYMFERLERGMQHFFYGDGTDLLYEGDFSLAKNDCMIEPKYGAIERAVKSGDGEKTKDLLSDFFGSLEEAAPTPALAKTYCLELYVCMIRCCDVEKIDKYMKGIVEIQNRKTLRGIKDFITEKAAEIVKANEPKTIRIYSSLIKDTIRVIDENIGNENLSLRWLAGTILYTNVDYLGKLFKKETGKNFSHYVMEKRMELAKELIIGGKKDRIYEVAEKVGYGSNSQYFSQVFKKYTGVSPLEYKEYAKMARSAM